MPARRRHLIATMLLIFLLAIPLLSGKHSAISIDLPPAPRNLAEEVVPSTCKSAPYIAYCKIKNVVHHLIESGEALNGKIKPADT